MTESPKRVVVNPMDLVDLTELEPSVEIVAGTKRTVSPVSFSESDKSVLVDFLLPSGLVSTIYSFDKIFVFEIIPIFFGFQQFFFHTRWR